MNRHVEVFSATQRHQKTKNKKQTKRNADKGSHGLLHIESNLDRLGLLSPSHDQRSQQKPEKLRSNQF